jgi:hypothetical protein
MPLTPLEWIGIAQAVILLLTAAVIVWYTLETARIRKETSTQNTLLAEQLRIMQATLQRDLDKEASFIRPFFKLLGGMHATNHASWDFENKGGTAYKLSTKSLDALSVTVSPTRVLDTNEQGQFQLKMTDPTRKDTCRFELHCTDKLGNQHSFKFLYQPGKAVRYDKPDNPKT